MVATPHAFGAAMDIDPDTRDDALTIFEAELQRRNIPLRLLPGFECLIVDGMIERISSDSRYLLPALGGRLCRSDRCLLVEIGGELPIACMEAVLFKCQLAGMNPVLAHPERHPEICRKPGCIETFVRKGGKLQITATALAGAKGWASRRLCEHLLRDGLVGCIASDAHCADDITAFGKALDRAKKIVGPAAEQLVLA